MSSTLPTRTEERPVAVIGAGTLGRRIAAVFAGGGSPVRIVDLDAGQRSSAAEFATRTAQQLAAERGTIPGRVETFEDVDGAIGGAWLVIEAVPERLEIKRPLFGRLDRLADADAVLATNSSSYASREVVDEVQRRERVLNMHFVMPPRRMGVELMSDGDTDPAVIEFLQERLRDYGLLPFVAHRESTGFIFNRIWAAIKREALAVVAEGVSTPEDVDALMAANLGMEERPFRLMDQVGLDVVLDIEEHYAAENPHLPSGPRELLRRYVEAGKLGVKTGEGFYTYPDEG